ncbi:putative zinc finger protein 800 [Scophthalmus maximus]|uniref:Putative zinc finger protein 800 n=1 Tax=Scophthalmus maximus TaxID=52904 RepID=A0A2U9B2L2_SCOMX|nr:putative zinc finger protein 800 [Scophthalmus maximus]
MATLDRQIPSPDCFLCGPWSSFVSAAKLRIVDNADSSLGHGDEEPRCPGEAVQLSEQGEGQLLPEEFLHNSPRINTHRSTRCTLARMSHPCWGVLQPGKLFSLSLVEYQPCPQPTRAHALTPLTFLSQSQTGAVFPELLICCVSLPVVSLEKMPCLNRADPASHVRLTTTSSSSSSHSPSSLKPPSLTPPASQRSGEKLTNGRSTGSATPPSSLDGRPRRVFDPNKHCGVQDPETKRPCTRSLTCKTHSLTHRRAVPGRRNNFDVLLAEHKGRAKEGAKEKEKEKDGGGAQGGGKESCSQSTSSQESPSKPHCPNGRPLSMLKIRLANAYIPRAPGGSTTSISSPLPPAPVPAPTTNPELSPLSWVTSAGDGCRLSSDEGEAETPEDTDRPAFHYSSHHPQPLGGCVFSSRLMGRGHYVFDRRWDRMRLALQSMVEKHLSSQMWRNGSSYQPISQGSRGGAASPARKQGLGRGGRGDDWLSRSDRSQSLSSQSRELASAPHQPPAPPSAPLAYRGRVEGRKRRSPGSYRGKASKLGEPGGLESLFGKGNDIGGILTSGAESTRQHAHVQSALMALASLTADSRAVPSSATDAALQARSLFTCASSIPQLGRSPGGRRAAPPGAQRQRLAEELVQSEPGTLRGEINNPPDPRHPRPRCSGPVEHTDPRRPHDEHKCHLRHSPRPRTPMGGDGVANGDSEREPIDTDSGGNDRRALSTLQEQQRLGARVSTRKTARCFRDGSVPITLPGMRKWTRARSGETRARAPQASRRAVCPSRPPLMVLGPCGCCGVAHVSQACAGSERAAQQASLGRMVKAHKSSGRKSSHALRRQSGGQTEMEEAQPLSDAQQPPQEQPHGEDQSSERAELGTSASAEALSENWDQEKDDSAAQARPMWKPIPPLLPDPEHHGSTSTGTKDQSCQTEEHLQQTSAGSHGHNTGVCAEPGDPPLLQQPLQTSKSGIQQIIECFRSGTSQLRHMLLREVDTIFECKLCRSLFRGLPNLITHKEYYCLSRLPETDGDDRQSVAMKDLLDTIYPRADRPDYVVRLEPIQTTTKAVFQHITTEEELARYPSQTPSARESPVAWEGEPAEGGDNSQASQRGGPESNSSPAPKRWEAEEEAKEDKPPPEDEGSTSGVEDVTISCCLCGQDFNSRRSIRRHCRKMHQTKLEELRKFTETRTVPTSLLSMVKGRPRTLSTPTGKSCPVCLKTFATKANVRRHFDEVHRGLRRDNTPSTTTWPGGQPLALEATPPRKSNNSSPTRSHSSKSTPVISKTTPSNQNQAKPPSQTPAPPPVNPAASCRCTICKRNYSSQLMLKRHMRIVHKIYSVKNNRSPAAAPPAAATTAATPNSSSANAGPSNNVRVKEEAVEPSGEDEEEEEEEGMDSTPAPSPSDSTGTAKVVPAAQNSMKVKEEEAPRSPKVAPSLSSSSSRGGSGGVATKMTKLSVGFDFKQLFCKLCKRQFSSRQNLTKHIELHTDGNDIFIKFYRCPLCRYESRRKRDVLRHVTVVHKQSSSYLAKIMPKLESRAVKRLAEVVLSSTSPNKRTSVKEEVNGRHASSSSPSPPSPPVTRNGAATTSTEVRVTKNFSLHACDQCGRAFAKKLYLESHKRSHRNAATAAASKRKGVSTRSKSLVW